MNLKQIGNVAVVGVGPDLRIIASIDQARINAEPIRDALDRAFQKIGDAKLLADFLQVAGDAGFVLLHTPMADHLEIRDFREVSQDFVLHAVREERVFLFCAQIFEGQDRDTFFRDTYTR